MSQFHLPPSNPLNTNAGTTKSSRHQGPGMITEGEFLARKGQHNQRVVWVNGFNKGWADLDPKHHANEIAMMGTAKARLELDLAELQEKYRIDAFRSRLVVVTHGVSFGLPGIAHEVCDRLGIQTVAVASAASLRSKPCVGEIIAAGANLSDESPILNRIADELWLFGGEELGKIEAETFAERGKERERVMSTRIYTLFGGPAGELTGDSIKACFVVS